MKKLILFLLLAGVSAFSQTTVAIAPLALPQFLDNSGSVCSGCKLSTFSAGTTSNLATYQDSSGTTPQTNPIVMDSTGRPPAPIFLTSAAYKFVMKDASGVTLWSADNITWGTPLATFAGIINTGNQTLQQSTAATSGANQSSNSLKIQGNYWNGAASATDTWTLQNVLGTGANPPSTLTLSHSGSSGTSTVSFGSVNFGALTATGLNSVGLASSSTIQSTINAACNGTIPGTAWMPVGTVSNVPVFTIPNNCTIKCPSPLACKITLANSSNANFITQASIPATNIAIEDMIIDGNTANQSGTSSCIYFQTANGVHVRHNLIQNCHNHAIFVDGCTTYVGASCTVATPSQNVWVEYNLLNAPANGHGVELGNGPSPADTVVTNFHVNYNTILHTTSALVNGIFVLGASSVGVCGTGQGEIIGNIINGATDTGIEVGQGSCQVTVTGNNISLGAVNGTTGIGIRSAQEITVNSNQVHGNGTNTTQTCFFFWNNAGNDDLRFRSVTASGNVAKGCTAASSFDVAVNAGNAGTAGAGDGLKFMGFVTDGGPASYNYLSLPANFDPMGNDDQRFNSSRTKPTRATQDAAGDGFYPFTAPLFQSSSPLNIELRASSQALPGGLYRMSVSGNQWLLVRNTAAAGDFSSTNTEIGDDGSGNISIQQGQLIAQGSSAATFRTTQAARFDEGTPGGATAAADVCQGDSTAHNLRCSMNNGPFQNFPISVVLHASYTNATTTFSNVSDGVRGMSWSIAANTDYTLDCTFTGQGSATTAGPKFQLTGPASPTLVSLMVDGGNGVNTYANGSVTGFSSANTALNTLGATATNFVWHVNASIANGVNSGTLILQAAANGAGTLTISGGSCQLQ